MNLIDIATFVRDLGLPSSLIMFFAWFLAMKIWPFITTTVWPEIVESRKRRSDALNLIVTQTSNLYIILARVEEGIADNASLIREQTNSLRVSISEHDKRVHEVKAKE